MPTRKPPRELDPEYLERAFVQVNVRVPLGTRARLDDYLDYVSEPEHRRPANTAYWPESLSGTVIAAIEDFLDRHPLTGKRGPTGKHKPKDYIRVKKTDTKIKPKGRTPNSGTIQEAEDEFKE